MCVSVHKTFTLLEDASTDFAQKGPLPETPHPRLERKPDVRCSCPHEPPLDPACNLDYLSSGERPKGLRTKLRLHRIRIRLPISSILSIY
jgi:hypothetical protein